MNIHKTQILSFYNVEVGKIEYFYNQRQGGYSYGIQIKVDKVAGEEPKTIILVNSFEKADDREHGMKDALTMVELELDKMSEKFNLYK